MKVNEFYQRKVIRSKVDGFSMFELQVQNDKIMKFDKQNAFYTRKWQYFLFSMATTNQNKNERRYECEYDLSDSCEMKSEANPLCKMVVKIISVK